MKIISGSLKGRNIKGYDIEGTRPTMDRVKESLFGMIQNNIKNSVCLDLFCGSGNLGIEAISNGSAFCYFIDNNLKAIKVVNDNIINLNIKDKTKTIVMDYKKCLKTFGTDNKKFDLIFADPPYDYHVIEKIINYVSEYNLLNDDGLLVLEFENEKLNETYGNLKLIKNRKYATKNVYIYQNQLTN